MPMEAVRPLMALQQAPRVGHRRPRARREAMSTSRRARSKQARCGLVLWAQSTGRTMHRTQVLLEFRIYFERTSSPTSVYCTGAIRLTDYSPVPPRWTLTPRHSSVSSLIACQRWHLRALSSLMFTHDQSRVEPGRRLHSKPYPCRMQIASGASVAQRAAGSWSCSTWMRHGAHAPESSSLAPWNTAAS